MPCGDRGVPCVRSASCVPCRGGGDVPSCGTPSCHACRGAWSPKNIHYIQFNGDILLTKLYLLIE